MTSKNDHYEKDKSIDLEDLINAWNDIVGADLSSLNKRKREAQENGNYEEYERLEKERRLVGQIYANGYSCAEETEYGRKKILEARERRKYLDKYVSELINKDKT